MGSRPLPQQSVHDGAGLQQCCAGGEQCSLSSRRAGYRLARAQIGPRGRNQRARTVGQHQGQMQLAASVAPAQHLERPPLKGMARAKDRYVLGKVVEVVGSLSSGLSTAWTEHS